MQPDGIACALQRLNVAVWVLVLLAALNLIALLFQTFFPPYIATRAMESLRGTPMASRIESMTRYNDFHAWSLEKQIESASVIALAEHKVADGKVRTYITEIFRQQPDVTFNYKVGDEYASHAQPVRENTTYGDGEVMFFVGSPAGFIYSTTYSGDRILGMGDLPISTLRKMIQAQK
jgi:hypothetical protein